MGLALALVTLTSRTMKDGLAIEREIITRLALWLDTSEPSDEREPPIRARSQ